MKNSILMRTNKDFYDMLKIKSLIEEKPMTKIQGEIAKKIKEDDAIVRGIYEKKCFKK